MYSQYLYSLPQLCSAYFVKLWTRQAFVINFLGRGTSGYHTTHRNIYDKIRIEILRLEDGEQSSSVLYIHGDCQVSIDPVFI